MRAPSSNLIAFELLVVKLECELDLSRVVWRIPRRADFAEGCAVERSRSGNRYDAVSTEARCIEVRVVENIEDF